jgi:hypothetical protein
MDADPSNTLPEAAQGQEINLENGQVAAKKPQLAPIATVATNEVLKGDRRSGTDGHLLKRAGGELLKDKPEVKRRNQRLFGTLLGTLQKFKREEDAMQSSATALRRAAMLQAAEEKTRKASTQYPEKHKRTKLDDNRNRLEQRYENGGTGYRRPPQVPFLLKTSTEPCLSWAPRESCPEVEAFLANQRKSTIQQVEKERSQDIDAHRASPFLQDRSGRGNTDGADNEEGKIDKEMQNESTVLEDKKKTLLKGIEADTGPRSNGKDKPSDSGGGGWKVVEDPTAEAFR